MVAQVLADRQRRVAEHRQLLGGGGGASAELPGVAALEAAVDQDAGPIHLLVEVVWHLLALGPETVQAEVLDQPDLVRGVRDGIAQEQVLRPAAAPEHERHPVDYELARPVWCESSAGRGTNQPRRDLADAECLGFAVRRVMAPADRHRQAVQRLAAHLVGPPHAGMVDEQPRVVARGEGERLGGAGSDGHGPADADATAPAEETAADSSPVCVVVV